MVHTDTMRSEYQIYAYALRWQDFFSKQEKIMPKFENRLTKIVLRNKQKIVEKVCVF